MKKVLKNIWNSFKNSTFSETLEPEEISNEEIIKAYNLLKRAEAIPEDEPNYELAKKVFLDFNDFNLRNTEDIHLLYLKYIPKSLLPYPKNYIKCAYYIFLEHLKNERDLKNFKNAQEIGLLLFYYYPNYIQYKKNLKRKKWLDDTLKDQNFRELFKKKYGVYEVSEEDYNSSANSIDSTEEQLVHDFGVLPEIEEDVDFSEVSKAVEK